MKPEHLSDAMNHLDDELVEEACASRQEKSPDSRPAPQKVSQKHWPRWAAAGACFALCIGGAALLWQGGWGAGQPLPIDPASMPQESSIPGGSPVPQQSQTPESSTPPIGPGGLPMLTITEDTSGGMGFEGYMAYDISELVSANPWTPDAELSTLPVYRNTLKSAAGDDFLPGQPYPVTEELSGKMRAFLLKVAGRLGLDTETLDITDDSPSEEYKAAIREKYAAVGDEPPEELFAPTQLQAEQNGIRLEIRPNMTVTIWYDTPVSLPAGYFFGYYNMSYDQAQASAEYLLQQYRDLIAMQNPQINVFMGDYNIYAQQSYSVSFFEGAGSLTEQIVNYNFNQIQFYNGEEDAFDLVRIFGPDLSDKIGDYPIITAEDAKELLLQGHYITTVPYEMPGEEWVRKAELVYRNGMYEEIYMPYYRFYVELPEAKRDNGLKTYGAYYVPAVEGQYLTNMPLWNGSFN